MPKAADQRQNKGMLLQSIYIGAGSRCEKCRNITFFGL